MGRLLPPVPEELLYLHVPRERSEPTFSRIYSLLSRLGCADRIIGLDTTAPVEAAMDYDKVYQRLDEARADSLAYLKAAIEGTALPDEPPEAPAAPGPCCAGRRTVPDAPPARRCAR